MRRAVMVVLLAALALGACGGAAEGTADASAASATESRGEPIVVKTRAVIAATAGADPIATGDVLEGSTLGSAPFCADGTLVDSHGSADPSLRLIVETITCPDGTVSLAFAPDLAPGERDTGSWIIVGGSGAFEGLRGSGEMEIAYGPSPDSPADVTFTGTVSR